MRLIPKKRCNICNRILTDGAPESVDCGGDCLKCTADIGQDPECQAVLYGEKRCIECGERLPLASFHKTSGRSADGHRNTCKLCRRAIEASRIRIKRGG